VYLLRRTLSILFTLMLAQMASATPVTTTWDAEVLPADHTMLIDSVTGAKLTFLTTKTKSQSFYFHERSWLSDESMIVFRGHRGLMGYITATGELVVLETPTGGVGGATCASKRPSIFAMRGNEALELTPDITVSPDPVRKRSTVKITARVIATLPYGGQLNGSWNDEYLSVGNGATINTIRISDGEVREICRIKKPLKWGGHLQWSHTSSNLLTFVGGPGEDFPHRIFLIDPKVGVYRPIYTQREGELVTHEAWWVDDQMVFCGATRPNGQDQSHVKVMDMKTGIVRIAGAGAWWPNATPSQLAERNWWHTAGSDDGRWVMADNWHGDIMLFEGTTTRPHMLTMGHRKYGSGLHPEPGWDRKGKKVIFSSHMVTHVKNDVRVCVATIPDSMQKANPAKKR
jgi:hypothetical protein